MQVELRDGGGRIAWFGLPFFIFGIFNTLMGLGILPMPSPSEAARRGSGLMGLALIGVGAAIALGRRWTVFDADQGRVIRGLSLIIPIRREERSLSEFTAVAVVIALDSNSDSADSYPVRLKARSGKDLTVCSSAKFGESRGRAEFLARFLHLDLEDRSTDHELVLSPERAGETLQERLRSGRLQPESVVRPLAMRSEVDEFDAQARLVIPEWRGAAIRFALGAAIPIAIAVYLIPVLTRSFHWTYTDAVQLVPAAFLIFAFGFLPLLGVIYSVLSAIRSRTVIIASRTGILIDRRGVWRRRATLIPVDDILALDYSDADSRLDSAHRDAMDAGRALSGSSTSARGSRLLSALKKCVPSKGIIVKSRHGLFVFGEGLPGEELRYLQSIITRALANF